MLISSHDGRSVPEWPITAAGLGIFGAILLVTFWTSQLTVENGNLVAKHVYGLRMLPLTDVAGAEPAMFVGLLFRDKDGRAIRSLASGRSWNEFWTTRAERICRQVERLAKEARGDAE